MSFAEVYEKHKGEVVDLTPKKPPVEAPDGPETDEVVGGGTLPPLEMGSATLGDYFGYSDLEVQSPEMKGKLDEIYLMSKEAGADDVKVYLDQLEGNIGEPKLGISRADHIYQYLKLIGRANNAYKEVETYGNKNSVSQQGQQDTVRIAGENA